MVTTHSPVFIDLSRNNTSIVRVEREIGGDVSGTTIFRPEKVKLSNEDREELKLLNMYDPFVAEFFFGGKTIVVEGDTEHSAFKEVVESNRNLFGDVHIVRARGKYTIIALCKILNQFGSPYAVLHDSDRMTITTKKGVVRANSAWAANEQILEIVAAAPNQSATFVASVPNFEEAMFGEPADGEKPYGAWEKVRKDADVRKKVTDLLMYLGKIGGQLPPGTMQWSNVDELSRAVDALDK